MHEIAWILIAVLTASAVGGVLAVRYEQRHPSSYTQPGTEPEDNRALDTAEQEEQGWVRSRSAWRAWQPDVVADASEAAQVAVERMARVNVEFRP
jgi:hypothetical protein